MKNYLKTKLYAIGLLMAPSLLFKTQHFRMHRRFGDHWYWANLREPRTFNEWLLRSKLDRGHSELGYLVDKAVVKNWVTEKLSEDLVIPTIGVYDSPEEVPLDKLPRPCILKPTHASGHVMILSGGSAELEKDDALQIMHHWLRLNHWAISGECQYRHVKPRIICEPLLGGGEDLPDYKFFCFRGSPAVVQIDLDRHTKHVRQFFDMDWNPQPFTLRYPMPSRKITMPAVFDKMKEIARNLSQDFDFVRVDLYCVDSRVYFGELTFHPESGVGPFSEYKVDHDLGRLFSLGRI